MAALVDGDRHLSRAFRISAIRRRGNAARLTFLRCKENRKSLHPDGFFVAEQSS